MAERLSSHPTVYKRRRLQGACDICKYKKIRCDSAKMPDNRCTNCISFNAECTHSTTRKKRSGIALSHYHSSASSAINTSSYKPQHRLSNLETSTESEIHPLVQAVLAPSSNSNFESQSSLGTLSQYIYHLERDLVALRQETRGTDNNPLLPRYLEANNSALNDETNSPENSLSTNDDADLTAQLKKLTVAASHTRHFGSSSLFSLLGTALRVQKGAQSKPPPPTDDSSVPFRRPPFWTIHPWEQLSDQLPTYQFPDRELLHELVGLFFDQVNVYWPLLHRPTFENDLKRDLHLTNQHFATLLLAVCSVASRYSDNPEVLLGGFESRHSSGWKWFSQIRQCWRSSSRTLSLYEIQAICLSILFTQGTSQPEACWVMVGIGIRYAQDVGAHRQKASKPSVESELWKRCFWILVCSDAIVCAFLGRPRATVSDDYTLDPLLECDDEYWETEDPASRFVQPPDKPSKLSFFNTFLRLMKILEYAQRTLYAANKLPGGSDGGQSDEEIVSYLDSELNKWFERIPSHLVWTSCSPGTVFYEQSAILHACYHHIRIIVHRPFIPLPNKPSPLPFPSLAICTNAARSCVHVLVAQSKSHIYLPFHHVQFAVFTSAIILLVNHWTNLKPNQILRDMEENMKNAYDCISVLSRLEGRWTPAGRFCDVIRGIYSYGDPSFTPAPVQQSIKPEEKDKSSPIQAPAQSQSQFVQGDFSQASMQGDEAQTTWDAVSFTNWDTWSKNRQNASSPAPTSDTSAGNTNWWEDVDGHSANRAHPNDVPHLNLSENLYMPISQFNSQWPPAMYNGNNNMGIGDAVMLWLQQPEEWMNLGRYDTTMT